MGLPLRFLNPANYSAMIKIAKVSDSLSKHMKRRCAYCDLDLGTGEDYPVVEFINHLVDRHSEKIDPRDADYYVKIIKKFTK